MLAKMLLALAVIVVVLASIVVLQPSEFRIARSSSVSVFPPAGFAEVNEIHNPGHQS